MPIQVTGSGQDDLGKFVCLIPGFCASCESACDVVVKYNATMINMKLKARGIDPDGPSIILKRKEEIGVTCGCYAKFHRQVAHISDTRKTRKKG